MNYIDCVKSFYFYKYILNRTIKKQKIAVIILKMRIFRNQSCQKMLMLYFHLIIV